MPLTLETLDYYEYNVLVWSSGVFIGTLLTGGLIVLGITCLVLLSSSNSGPPKQRRLLQVFIFALLLATIGLELSFFFVAHSLGLFQIHTQEEVYEDIIGKLRFSMDLLPVIVLAMSDGLLVWRCYMVQRAIGESGKWQNIFWIFPGCLWILNWVVGIWDMADERTAMTIGGLLQATLYISNAALNVHTTLFISLRLFLHRRMVVESLGANAPPARYMHIISILLQSAAINVPIAIMVAVGVLVESSLAVAGVPIACAAQAFACVLIIHQVAIGRTLGSRKEESREPLLGSGGPEFEKPDSDV